MQRRTEYYTETNNIINSRPVLHERITVQKTETYVI